MQLGKNSAKTAIYSSCRTITQLSRSSCCNAKENKKKGLNQNDDSAELFSEKIFILDQQKHMVRVKFRIGPMVSVKCKTNRIEYKKVWMEYLNKEGKAPLKCYHDK